MPHPEFINFILQFDGHLRQFPRRQLPFPVSLKMIGALQKLDLSEMQG